MATSPTVNVTVVPVSAVRLLVNSVTVPSVPVMPETIPVAPAVPLQEPVTIAPATRLSVVSWTVMIACSESRRSA